MKEIGAKLRAAREAKNISLEDIQVQTKIRRRYLEAIESGDWEVIPGEVYRRGFVCNYAGVVGLDGEELIREYRQVKESEDKDTGLKSGGSEGEPGTAPQLSEDTALERAKPLWRERLIPLLILGGALVVILVVFGGLFKNKPATADLKPVVTQKRERAVKPQKIALSQPGAARNTPQPAATLTVQQIYPAPLVVYAEFSERVWLQVTIDGKVKYSNDGITFTARSPKQLWTANQQMVIRVGNSGGIRLSLNGKDLGVIGMRAEARTVTITADKVKIE
jgi:cytoskeletal protein RodZ